MSTSQPPKKVKPTKRARLVKLELSNNPQLAVEKVGKNLYNIGSALKPASDGDDWYTVDSLYMDAKKAYDGILKPFFEEPQVYKLDGTKDKVHAQSYDLNAAKLPILEEIEEFEAQPTPSLSDDFDTTFLDPFQLPFPWQTMFEDGRTVYFNPETYERVYVRPRELWTKKYEFLSKLVPRHDLNGYEYKESASERRFRIKAQDDFDKKLQQKIERRENNPTQIEQVEDTLFAIVDTICKKEELEEKRRRKIEVKKRRSRYHVSTEGYRMTPLVFEKDNEKVEDEEEERLVTDLDFVDAVITDLNYTLPTTRPYDLLEKHEAEREVVRVIERERLRIEEEERNRPFVEKAIMTYHDLRSDPKATIAKLRSDAKNNIVKLPTLLRSASQNAFEKSKGALKVALKEAVKVAQNPRPFLSSAASSVINTVSSVVRGIIPAKKELELDIDEIMQEMAGEDEVAAAEAEKKRLYEEWLRTRSKAPIPQEHPDVVFVKLVLAVDPPPRWVKRKPKSWKTDLKEFIGTDKLFKPVPKLSEKSEDDEELQNEEIEEVKDIFDTTDFDKFELDLKSQIALAVNIPLRAISIEEITRKPVNDRKVMSLLKRNDAIFEEQRRCEAEKKKAIDDEFNERVAKVEEILNFEIKLPFFPPLSSIAQEKSLLNETSTAVIEEFPLDKKVSCAAVEAKPQDIAPSLRIGRRGAEAAVACEISEQDIIGEIMENLIVQVIMRVNGLVEGVEVLDTNDDTDSSGIDNQSDILALEGLKPMVPPSFEKYEPKRPEYLRMGIPNVDDLKHDPNYWLAKELHKLTEDEKRAKRIHRLKQLEKEEGLQKTLKVFQAKRRAIMEEIEDFIEPIHDVLLPVAVAVGRKAMRGMHQLFNYTKSFRRFKKLSLSSTVSLENSGVESESLMSLSQEVHDILDDMCVEVVRRNTTPGERCDLKIRKIIFLNDDDTDYEVRKNVHVRLCFANWNFKTESQLYDNDYDSNVWRNVNAELTTTTVSLHLVNLIAEVFLCSESEDDVSLTSKQSKTSRTITPDSQAENVHSDLIGVTSVSIHNITESEIELISNVTSPDGHVCGQLHFFISGKFYIYVEPQYHPDIEELMNDMCAEVEARKQMDDHIQDEVTSLLESVVKWVVFENRPEVEKSVDRAVHLSLLPENAKFVKEINKIQRNLYIAVDSGKNAEAEAFFSLLFNARTELYSEDIVYLLDKISAVIANGEEYAITSDEEDDEDEDEDDDDDEEDDDDDDDDDDEDDENNDDERSENGDDTEGNDGVNEEIVGNVGELDENGNDLKLADTEAGFLTTDKDEGSSNLDYFPESSTEEFGSSILDGSTSQEIVDQVDADDDSEVSVSSVHSSELSLDESVLDLPKKKIKRRKLPTIIEEPGQPLNSCEITLKLFSPSELKVFEGLHDLKAVDFAFYLRDQLFDLESPLRKGSVTKNIIDISFQNAYVRRKFTSWEKYWVYIISPIFFGYTASKIRKRDHDKDDGRLPSGLSFVNPTTKFSERTKEAYFAITAEQPDKKRGKRAKEKSIVNLNIDEFANDKLLEIFRPNMQKLIKRDVDKCRRVWEAFENLYQDEMKKGLVDGKRLRIEQFNAMKNRDIAFRIYRTARQRFGREMRKDGDNTGPVVMPTEVSSEMYSGWMREVREEEELILKEERLKAAELRIIRIQETETRMKYTANKSFVINKIITLCPDARELGTILQGELMKEESEMLLGRSSDAPETLKIKTREKERVLKEALIHAERQTRALFDQYIKWSGPKGYLLSSDPEKEGLKYAKIESLLQYISLGKDQFFDDRKRDAKIKKLEVDLQKKFVEERRLIKLHEAIDIANGIIKEQLKVSFSREMEALQKVIEERPSKSIQDEIDEVDCNRLNHFPADEVAVFKTSRWIEIVFTSPDFFQALCEFPTSRKNLMTKDELSQFAVIVTQISPSVYGAKYILAGNKDKEAKELGLKSIREKKKQDRRQARKNNDDAALEELDDENLDETQRALKAEAKMREKKSVMANQRRLRREEEWLMAHQHLFVAIPGEAPFCVACKEVAYRLWNKRHTDKENLWTKSYSEYLSEKLEEANARFMALAEKAVLQLEYSMSLVDSASSRARPEVVLAVNNIISQLEEDFLEVKVTPLSSKLMHPGKWIRGLRFPKDMPIVAENIPAGVYRSGLCLLDANGLNILGKNASNTTPIELPADRPITPEIFGIKPLLMIHVWNKVDGVTKDFLGRVLLNAELLLNPELGIRAYDLEIDPTVAKKQENERRKQDAIEAHKQKGKPKVLKAQSQEAFSISGKMFLRISVPKSDKNDIPIVWRVEIVKASKIASAHKTQKSTPFCQVFWRGVAEVDGVTKEYDEWLEIGVTKAKERTLDPQWKKDDGNTFEMPPIWTKYDVPGRGPTGETIKGGCWVARNNLPEGDPAAAKTKLSALDRMRKEEKAGKEAAEQRVLQAMHNHDENLAEIFQQTNTSENSERGRLDKLIKTERNTRMEMYRFMLESEETERKCMSIEDNLMRKYIIDAEIQRTKKYIDEQVLFSKQYSRIIYSLINPPQVLERVQYNMGRPLDGGGTRVMCQDPSSRKTFEVIAIPILYEEDEEMLTKQLSFMIGRFHLNLIKISDYSIHQLRKFTHSGFTSADERVAMVITDCPIGPLFGDFVRMNWGSMSNHQFRVYLQQIVGALSQLHSDGIIHRNIHPECVVVLLPETEVVEEELEDDSGAEKGSKLEIKKFKYDQPVCKLGDYWFLHNPRKSGCAYSLGRADWGAPATAAPEVTQGAPISNKTDIWALGMCLFHWATCGAYPNFNFDSLETIRNHIPLKWDSWVHSIIRMCLQQNRDYRASADEIFTFLGTLKLKR